MKGDLRDRSRLAIANPQLHQALASATDRLAMGRALAIEGVNWAELREAGRAIRAQILSRLPDVLEQLADGVQRNGGKVFFAGDAEEATAYVQAVAMSNGSKLAVKSKSMASEEIELNRALEHIGVEVVETDLGEWIIQLAGERPSHIIAPALHHTRRTVADLFNAHGGGDLPDDPAALCAFARAKLREKFLRADLGISGVNFGVAESGSIVIVTNEGNGRMVTSLPRTHIAIMGMERVVETWEQLDVLLTLLTRAATGQHISSYVTAVTGPRRAGESDGPDEFHLVILDNGRSDAIGTDMQEVLHCIRCGACLNACPVYRQIGGHAYGGVYSGPIGAALTPVLEPSEAEVAGASSLCAACHHACPVGIPLQDLLLTIRRKSASDSKASERAGWRAWAAAWSRPATYRASARLAQTAARMMPEAFGPKGWTHGRTLPRPGPGNFRKRFERGEI
jgi:L-lactate dehydrogenase complex protein LldF